MPRLKPFLILIIILLSKVALGQGESIGDGVNSAYLVSKMHARKLLLEIRQDYDIGKPNPKHDPRRGKPGIGGANP